MTAEKSRAIILAEGYIQQAGYRDFVYEHAALNGLKGTARNLADGSVEIVCEGPKTSIRDFIKAINVKKFPIIVESLKTIYTQPTGEFKTFNIIWEEGTNPIMERLAIGARYLRELGQKTDNVGKDVRLVGEKVDTLGSKIDNVGKDVRLVGEKVGRVGEKVDKLTSTTVQSFTHLDTKYDRMTKAIVDISAFQANILNQLKEDRKEARRETKELVEAILKTRGV